MKTLSRSLFLAALFSGFLVALEAQTATVIPDAEAAQHIGAHATVEGIVVEVFTGKHGNTFLNFGAAYPNQSFTGWIPNSSPLASDASLSALEGQKVRISGTISLYRGKAEIKIMSKDQLTLE